MNTRTNLILVVAAASLVGGCVNRDNDRITLGRGTRLEAFDSRRPANASVVPAGLVERSVVTVERDNWQKTEIVVPVDGTAHNPLFARRINDTNKSRRQREMYPTVVSSLELSNGSEGQQQYEALYNNLIAVADGIFLVPRMIWRAPWRTDASPDEGYARYARPELAPGQRAPIPEDTDPFAEPAPRSVTP